MRPQLRSTVGDRRVLRSTSTHASSKCWLVGAGPGSLELMTLRSVELLYAADCVVYDDLVPQESLAFCRPGAEVVYVGKRGGRPSLKQPEINKLLVDKCRSHATVLRLKGGCPSLFSRVAAEMECLAAAGVPFELVPGVSSPSAAAAAAGFPLTDTVLASSVAVLSAHAPDEVAWESYGPAHVGTLVCLMGGRSIEKVVQACTRAGWLSTTPVAVVRGASTATERTWSGELQSIVKITQGENLSPCIIVIGPVVALGSEGPVAVASACSPS